MVWNIPPFFASLRFVRPWLNRHTRFAPMATSTTAVIGCALSSGRLDKNIAPTNPASAPGNPSRATTDQSTLPNRQWLKPETAVVPSSATCTTAEACAAPKPARPRRIVVEVTPKPMPMPPSTSCAAKPARAIKIKPLMIFLKSARLLPLRVPCLVVGNR